MRLPYCGGNNHVPGRCVAEPSVELRRVAIEIEQQRREFLLESENIERLAGRDDALDLLRRGPKRIARAVFHFLVRDVDEVENDERRAHRGESVVGEPGPA